MSRGERVSMKSEGRGSTRNEEEKVGEARGGEVGKLKEIKW